MHKKTNRTRGRSLPASSSIALSIAIVVVSCVGLFYIATRSITPQAHASEATTSTVSSSPSSGPVGTTVTVSGSGWQEPAGMQVYFGYVVNSKCSIVSSSQNGTISGGAFSGWFSWPLSTPKDNYTVCALINAQSFSAGAFTVLSQSAPQVSITPGTLQENQQATITATNYVPADTSISFLWTTTSGTVERVIGSTVSNSGGTGLFTFAVPISSLPSGSYLIEAEAGGGQPPAYFSSVSFTYNAPIIPPSPTPSPKPSPSPTRAPSPSPTQNPIATATATLSATVTAQSSPTAGTTTTSTPTHTGTTPSTVANGGGTPTTSSTATNGNGGSSSSGGQSNGNTLAPVIIGALVVLGALLTLLLLLRRRQTTQLARLQPTLPPFPPGAGQFAQDGAMGMPGMIPPVPPMAGQPGQYQPGGFQQMSPAPSMIPMPVGAGANYTPASPGGQAGPAPVQAPYAYRSLLNPTTPPPTSSTPANSDGSAIMQAPVDPMLDAMRRQAQAGLYVAPVPRGGSDGM